MYAIVNIYGHQYRVTEQERVKVSLLASEAGQKVTFDQVLLLDDGKTIKIGGPFVKNATVTANILEHGRDRKILIYKKKRRKGYQRKNGHRQDYTLIQIEKIDVAATKKAAPKKDVTKTVAKTGKE
ncbi:MAG: 50S ribosomal protein L21 [Candidatus Marinimicrobia bacterium]|nr:50S ribosomal protein L21 [Candidatus Neomarinimicrobiota bacterium]